MNADVRIVTDGPCAHNARVELLDEDGNVRGTLGGVSRAEVVLDVGDAQALP